MKTKILSFGLVLIMSFHVQAQQSKFLRALSDVLQVINQATTNVKSITVQTVDVNSIAKARFSNGHTRQIIPITLPQGTERWYYRITVMDVKSNYYYPANETFYYVLSNNVSIDHMYTPTNDGVDFFLLTTSGDASSFSETGNNNFTYLDGYEKLQTNSFIGEGPNPNTLSGNLWIGVRNDNKIEGLRVIVEVVAWGHIY
jgi:hypothetical protein